MTGPHRTEDLLRSLAPQVLGALVRRYGHFDAAEDAVQEALLSAARQWPERGRPDNPRGWLIRVASRRLTDELRGAEARRRREHTATMLAPRESRAPAEDDTLTMLLLCCHPDLTPTSRIALTLRAVGGLTTAEIARAFLVPEGTMAWGHLPAARLGEDQPRQADRQAGHPAGGRPLRAAGGRRAHRTADRGPARSVPDIQRGVYGDLRRHPAARRAVR